MYASLPRCASITRIYGFYDASWQHQCHKGHHVRGSAMFRCHIRFFGCVSLATSEECKRRYNIKLWKQFCDVFNCMSVCVTWAAQFKCTWARSEVWTSISVKTAVMQCFGSPGEAIIDEKIVCMHGVFHARRSQKVEQNSETKQTYCQIARL